MKKIFAALLAAGVLSGCSPEPPSETPDAAAESSSQSVTPEGPSLPEDTAAEDAAAFPGRYTVPEGWVKAEEHSTAQKTFYTMQGHETDATPDNISVEVGTNRYRAEEHTAFRDAVMRQLLAQLQGVDAELNGDGTYTAQDYPVYIFTIRENGQDIVTRQYYIVDDYRYCLIHLTRYSGLEEADQAAQAMADSFVWNQA